MFSSLPWANSEKGPRHGQADGPPIHLKDTPRQGLPFPHLQKRPLKKKGEKMGGEHRSAGVAERPLDDFRAIFPLSNQADSTFHPKFFVKMTALLF